MKSVERAAAVSQNKESSVESSTGSVYVINSCLTFGVREHFIHGDLHCEVHESELT